MDPKVEQNHATTVCSMLDIIRRHGVQSHLYYFCKKEGFSYNFKKQFKSLLNKIFFYDKINFVPIFILHPLEKKKPDFIYKYSITRG